MKEFVIPWIQPLGVISAEQLIRKLRNTRIVDDPVSDEAIQILQDERIVKELFEKARICRDRNGADYIRSIFPSIPRYSHIEDENKEQYWCLCIAFMILYYESHPNAAFEPLVSTPANEMIEGFLTEEFRSFCEEFHACLIMETLDACKALIFYWGMKLAVPIFGKKGTMVFLVELITRMTEGHNAALTCNTSGGAFKSDTLPKDPKSKVYMEFCKMSIYERTSGHKKLVRRSRRRPAQDEETETQAFRNQQIDSGGSADEMDTSTQQAIIKAEFNESDIVGSSSTSQFAFSGYRGHDLVDPTTQRFIENADTMRPHPLLLLSSGRPQHHMPQSYTPYGENGGPISPLPRFPSQG